MTWQRVYSNVNIGDVTIPVEPANNPSLVPFGYLSKFGDLSSPELIAHMRWIAQKHVIGQDTFLLSHPGTPLTRNLIFGTRALHCIHVSFIICYYSLFYSDKTNLVIYNMTLNAYLFIS